MTTEVRPGRAVDQRSPAELIGAVIDSRYRIEAHLGGGGMGSV